MEKEYTPPVSNTDKMNEEVFGNGEGYGGLTIVNPGITKVIPGLCYTYIPAVHTHLETYHN
jgi:hypothetical protein